MKLKNISVIFAVIMASVFTSCSWLDVSPADEISADEMFKKPEGFHNVLNGIYLKIGEPALYGATLSWKEMEAWGHAYSLDKDNHEGLVALMELQYDNKKVVGVGETIWTNAYKNIARVNMLLQYTQSKPDNFFPHGSVEKNLIMGEALAIRAYLHFDLLRVFAADMKTGKDKSYIPFVSVYPSLVNPPMPSSQVLEHIKADLSQAAEYLAPYDTDEDNRQFVFNSGYRFSKEQRAEWGTFFSIRGCRFNYYAIRILQARVALYEENYSEAVVFAKEIKDLVKKDGNSSLSFQNEDDFFNNPKMLHETLFAFRYTKLIENTQDYFSNDSDFTIYMDDPDFIKEDDKDARSVLVDENDVLNVYKESKNGALVEYVPALKLSEVYYILAESYTHLSLDEEAVKVFNEFLEARGVEPVSITGTELIDYMLQDARKEFAGMGQYVFMCKRLNERIRYSGGMVSESLLGHYIFPIPVSNDVSNK